MNLKLSMQCELQCTQIVCAIVVVVSYLMKIVASTENYFTTNAENFSSVPTTVKTYENDTVLLPCYSVCKYLKCLVLFAMVIVFCFLPNDIQFHSHHKKLKKKKKK